MATMRNLEQTSDIFHVVGIMDIMDIHKPFKY
jgi:hypothetical protein